MTIKGQQCYRAIVYGVGREFLIKIIVDRYLIPQWKECFSRMALKVTKSPRNHSWGILASLQQQKNHI